MKIKDKNNLLQKVSKDLLDTKKGKLEKILHAFSEKYDMIEPEIIDVNLEYDLEIFIIDKKIDSRVYKVIISPTLNDLVYVEISDQNYLDVYNYFNQGYFVLKKRIYYNHYKDEKIEKSFFDKNDSFNLPSSNDKNYNKGYFYKFQNSYLNSEIDINIPDNFSFNESLFIKEIFASPIKVTDIDILFYIIKKALKCLQVTIEIKNRAELIYYQNGNLMEYIRFKDNKKIEYRNGYKELIVTKYEHDSLENKDFQKILKIVRS